MRTTISDLPTEVNQAAPAAAPEVAKSPFNASEENVFNAIATLLSNPHFIGGLATELEKERRKQTLYPLMLRNEQLQKPGVVMAQPQVVQGHALILTRFPTLVGGATANSPAIAVLARQRAIPQEQLTADPKADYERNLDVVIYQDHPFDLNQRVVMNLGDDLEKELRRQLVTMGTGDLTQASSAFYYLTLVKVDAPATEGAANGRAG
ncbi:hypothetical protein D3C71_79070 [compost metagenome]